MSEHVSTPATAASTAGRRPAGVFWWATAATGVAVVAIGVFGTLAHRGFGRVPFSVPAWPWYHSDPFYLFWDPSWPSAWVAVALAAATGAVALFRSHARTGVRVAASAGLLLVLALAVAALDGGSAAWRAPLEFTGEYPTGSSRSGTSRRSCGSSPSGWRPCPAMPADIPPAQWCCMRCWRASGPGWTGRRC